MIEKSDYKKLGMKMTPQRAAILKKLEGNTSHPSAEDIYSELKDEMPMLSLATVYNTLQFLHEKGLILQLSLDPAKKHYDPNTRTHHHFFCCECNQITDIFEDIQLRTGNALNGYTVQSKEVSFSGICPDCK